MNIAPTYPNLVPMAQQPTTEAARRDNQSRTLLPPPQAGNALAREPGVGGDKEKGRSVEARPEAQRQGEGLAGSASADARAVRAVGERQSRGDRQPGGGREDARREAQEQEVAALKARDKEVRIHEQAHQQAGGRYASAPAYHLSRGPDGRSYAVGGEVQIDVSPIAGDPSATVQKMQQVRAAALAPQEPSAQDRAVAARATQAEATARNRLADEKLAPKSEAALAAAGEGEGESRDPATLRHARVIARRYQSSGQPAPSPSLSRLA